MGRGKIQWRAGLGILVLAMQGCAANSSAEFLARWSGTPSAIDPAIQGLSVDGKQLLRGFLSSGRLPILQQPDFALQQKEAEKFYDNCNGELAWIEQAKPTAQARAMIQAFKNAEFKGLQPEDYDAARWDERLAEFSRPAHTPEADLVQFDLALTVSAMRYISDLHMGRVNPGIFHFGLDIGRQQFAISDFLREKVASAADVKAVLETVEPPFPIYRRTEDALRNYMEIALEPQSAPLPAFSKPVKPGDAYDGAFQLANLLATFGDLATGSRDAYRDGIYRGGLVDAVKAFQLRHGLPASGILDAPTLKELNIPISRRVTQLQLAMERMRWLPHQFDRPPIVVNIPEFRLYAVNEEYRSVFTMKVVTGKAYGHQTPVFANEIRSVIFRPYWNVPESITRAEMIPHIRKNPSYLATNSYELVDRNGNVQGEPPTAAQLERQLRSGALRIRQSPGAANALGLLKFEFPNQYDVYMHGTPAKELFARSRRDFSHGCIRVEDPVALAKWVLRDMPEWTEEKIRAAMDGDETREVRLKQPIPVLIFYSTAVVLEGGDVHFFDDVYGLDADLERAVAQRTARPSSGIASQHQD